MSSDDEGSLDLFSPTFKAEKALLHVSPQMVRNLDMNVLPLDSMYKARYILPEGDPDRIEITYEEDDDGEANADTSLVRRTSLIEKPRPKSEKFQLPFASMASSYVEGPLNLLRTSLEQMIRVKVRRRKGETSWCTGTLIGFDRHFNILLARGEESYVVKEDLFISARRKTLKDKIMLFLQDFTTGTLAVNHPIDQMAEMLMVRFGSDDHALWRHLHEEYGVTNRVRQLENNRDVDVLLSKWRGNELELIQRLEAKATSKPAPSTVTIAEWVRMASEKYPGSFFYFNNRTKESRWEPPAGVTFRKIKAAVTRKRPFEHLIVRGDTIMLVSSKRSHPES